MGSGYEAPVKIAVTWSGGILIERAVSGGAAIAGARACEPCC